MRVGKITTLIGLMSITDRVYTALSKLFRILTGIRTRLFSGWCWSNFIALHATPLFLPALHMYSFFFPLQAQSSINRIPYGLAWFPLESIRDALAFHVPQEVFTNALAPRGSDNPQRLYVSPPFDKSAPTP